MENSEVDLFTQTKESNKKKFEENAKRMLNCVEKVMCYYYKAVPSEFPFEEAQHMSKSTLIRTTISKAVVGADHSQPDQEEEFIRCLESRTCHKVKRKDILQVIVFRKLKHHWSLAMKKSEELECTCVNADFGKTSSVKFKAYLAKLDMKKATIRQLAGKEPFKNAFYNSKCYEHVIEKMDQDTNSDIRRNIVDKVEWALGLPPNARVPKKYRKAPPSSDQEALDGLMMMLTSPKKSKLPLSRIQNREAVGFFIDKLSNRPAFYQLDTGKLKESKTWSDTILKTESDRFKNIPILTYICNNPTDL